MAGDAPKRLACLLCAMLSVTSGAAGDSVQKRVTVNPAEVEMTLDMSPCVGKCSEFSITVFGDGRVEYVGRENVAVLGMRTTQIEQEKATELLNAFLGSNFFDFRDYYARLTYVEFDRGVFFEKSDRVLDMQEVRLSLKYREREKTVTVAFNGPSDFDRITFEFERLTNLAELIGQKLGD